MPAIDCQACGRTLELPATFPEGGAFACGHCGMWIRNVEAARRFRFADLDPYVRRHGASRVNLWGGTVGAALWLPILAGVLAWRGMLDAGFLAAVGLPYVVLLAVLFRRRAGAPAAPKRGSKKVREDAGKAIPPCRFCKRLLRPELCTAMGLARFVCTCPVSSSSLSS